MKYVISQKALESIERVCRVLPETETGGILVGFRDENQATITHATGPGLDWEASAHHFVKDTRYLQKVLELLFQYFQVNYLGVWHKHPVAMPFPSGGDVSSAMEEIEDNQLDLDELITPICVLQANKVIVHPFVVKDHNYAALEWETVPHHQLAHAGSLGTHWYTRSVGRKRLAEEMERFKELGIESEIRQGTDGTYRFHVPLVRDGREQSSIKRLVLLCPEEYPVAPPEVAVYDQETKTYEPVSLAILDNWNVFRYLGDLVQEYRG